MKIKISNHAVMRAKERLGLKYKELEVAAVSSLENGIDAMADEALRPALIRSAVRHNASGIYLYANGVYIFKEDCLVTVYPISWINVL